MTTQEIRNRIEKKEQEIAKLVAKFNKYSELVSEEFLAIINQYLEDGQFAPVKEYRIRTYPNSCMLNGNDYDLYAAASDLYNARVTLAKYQKQLEAAEAKENTINELPAVIKEFGEELYNRWNKYDFWKKEEIRREYKTKPEYREREAYREFQREMNEKWGRGWYEFAYYTTDEQIKKNNRNAVDALILNLVTRTIEIAGTIKDAKYLRLDRDNNGYAIINGIVIGEKGKARVESIGAGGYNIQRYHIRVLVKEVRA